MNEEINKPWENDYKNEYKNIQKTYVRGYEKKKRNDPCKCGSGKKYKKCCLNKWV